MKPITVEQVEQFVGSFMEKLTTAQTTESSETRLRLMEELYDGLDALQLAKKFYSNPLNLATSYQVDSAARAYAGMNIAGMLPAQITSVRLLVEATGDRVIGAALIQKNDMMPTNMRPFVSRDLADKLFGKDCKRVLDIIERATSRYNAAALRK